MKHVSLSFQNGLQTFDKHLWCAWSYFRLSTYFMGGLHTYSSDVWNQTYVTFFTPILIFWVSFEKKLESIFFLKDMNHCGKELLWIILFGLHMLTKAVSLKINCLKLTIFIFPVGIYTYNHLLDILIFIVLQYSTLW